MTRSVGFVLSVVAVLAMVKFSPRLTADITLSQVPSFSSLVSPWLRPPFLYLVINCIIVTIFASSKLQQRHDHSEPSKNITAENYYDDEDQSKLADVMQPQSLTETECDVEVSDELYGNGNYSVATTSSTVQIANNLQLDASNNANTISYFDDGTQKSANFETWEFPRSASLVHPKVVQANIEGEKKLGGPKPEQEIETLDTSWKTITEGRPMPITHQHTGGGNYSVPTTSSTVQIANNLQLDASNNDNISYFDDGTQKGANYETWEFLRSASFVHPKVVEANTEGEKKLGGPKPEQELETLDSTWKAITEGRPMPITHQHSTGGGNLQNSHEMITSETFNQQLGSNRNNVSRTLAGSSILGKLKRDPSPGQEELNKRVEAFISRFKEDMRLQRKESLRQYVEMINSSA